MISKCLNYCKSKKQNAEPPKPILFSEHSWLQVATDLFEWKKTSYILVVDYYSCYIEIASLRTTNSSGVIQKLKTVFARHGISECIVSDNGPQFFSQEFKRFIWRIWLWADKQSKLSTSKWRSWERAVRTVKTLLNKNDDPLMALLVHRSTPLENGYSPPKLLMGHKLRTIVPVIPKVLQPKLPNQNTLREKKREIRRMQ